LKPKLIAIFLLIVLLPLLLLAWIGIRGARDEREVVQRRIRQLLTSKLWDAEAVIEGILQERERMSLEATDRQPHTAAAIRDLVRRNAIVRQAFVLGPDGKRTHPPPAGPVNDSERRFLQRAGQIWQDKQVFYHESEAPSDHGWYVWFWGRGLNIVFWRRVDSGHVIGVELNRPRLLSGIIAALPDSDPVHPRLPHGRIALVDSKGDVIYQWGAYEPADGEPPSVSLNLKHPLSSWRLDHFAPGAALGKAFAGRMMFNLISALLAVGIALVGLAVYFYRESSRDLREAAQRVSFVNQVSHELKTPLTNIRMYGELLQGSVPEEDEKASRYVGIIVAESQRLSRLIGNILTFSRKRRGRVELRTAAGNVDETIESVLEHFRPSLEAKGVQVVFTLGARATVKFDADALEQILGNLFGNVEKYAASGGMMEVASRQDGEKTIIAVSDRGPGISKDQRERIFEPFHRVSNKLTDGVTGTGIGLAIARDLARLHGGDLVLIPSDEGACFEVTLRTPAPSEHGRGAR